ncbi:MAG: protease inhibitor I42 family protein [Kiritimatiellia bacterium]
MKHGILIGIFLVASLLTGCGDSSADDLALTEAQNGETVALEPGDMFSVELSGNPTTGYEWTVVRIDAEFLRLAESSYDSDSSAIGSGGAYVFRFETLKAGETTLALAYRRPWETTASDRAFTLVVDIQNP